MKDSNEFGKNMNELLRLLKKILKSQKLSPGDLSGILDKKNVNLNLCFFTFLPLTEEEFADLEYDMEEFFLDGDSEGSGGDLKFEITTKDMDFLKKNGLKF